MGKGGGKCASRERFASSSRTPRLPAPRHSTTFKPAESSRAVGPESSPSRIREPFLSKREETSRSTEQDPLNGEDNDLETDVIFDQPETVSESRRHLLSLSPADRMQNGSATKEPTAGASSQVALAATAKEEPTISHHEPKVEVSSIPVARAARKEPVILGDISTVSSTNIETKPPQHPPLTMDTGVRMVAPGRTKSQLNTKHITPAAESSQVSQVSALPLAVGMVYEMSNQVNKEDPSVFKKTNDVKEEATNSAFNVQKPDVPRDEEDTKKMEQENMTASLLRGSRQPSRVEKSTTPALAEKTLVESVNKGAPVVPREEIYSHIERVPMLPHVEAEVESEPATLSEEAGVDEASTIEEAHKDAPLSEASPVLEEKAVTEVEDEDMSSSLEREEAGFGEAAVEECAVEEAAPLVEEKEFGALEEEAAAPAEVESEPATVSEEGGVDEASTIEEGGVDVAATIEELHEDVPVSEASPVLEEKVVTEVEDEDMSSLHESEEAGFEEATVEECAVEEAAPLVEEKEFVAPEEEAAASAEVESEPATVSEEGGVDGTSTIEEGGVDVAATIEELHEDVPVSEASPVLEEKAVSEEENEDMSSSLEREEAGFAEAAVEECVVKEAAPLVEEKEFVAAEEEAVASADVESEPATVSEEGGVDEASTIEEAGVDVAATIEEVDGDARFSEASPVLEEKAVTEVEDEDMSSSHEREEAGFEQAGFEEAAVEECAVEEAAPLVEEKEFVAAEEEAAASANVESEPATVSEEGGVDEASTIEEAGVDVAATIEELHEDVPVSEASPVLEEKAVGEVEDEDMSSSHEREEAGFEEAAVEECAVEEAAPLVEEKEFVAAEEEAAASADVESEPATVLEEGGVDEASTIEEAGVDVAATIEEAGVDVAATIEELHEDVPVSEASPVLEEKAVTEVEDEDMSSSHEREEAGFEEAAVEECAVEEAAPLVEEKEFVAAEEEAAASAKVESEPATVSEEGGVDEASTIEEGGVDVAATIEELHEDVPVSEASPVLEEKAVSEEENEDMSSSLEREEAGFAKAAVEECAVEEAAPLVEEKEFVAAEEEAAASADVESEPATVSEEGGVDEASTIEEAGVDVAATIEEVHEDAPLSEASPVLEEKAVGEVEDEDMSSSLEREEAGFEEAAVEEYAVEEATPLVVKEFVAPEEEAPASVEVVESVMEEVKAIDVEGEVESEPATVSEEAGVDVMSTTEEALEDAPLTEGSPVLEEKDNTCVEIDHENATVVESRQIPSVVAVEIIEEPSVATTVENMEVSGDPHRPKKDEQEETKLSREEEHDSEAFSQFVSKDIQLASDKSKDVRSVLQSLENSSGVFISDLLLEGSEEVDAAPSA